ncbi:hypothetical protein DERP_004116 [Dermatophagoides pteronyssinus]|uniref:Uncharacterized protein n=1 Tax=Dermatophagoides pteronyssinus TaxID=6956 RepID=A0ABQ8J886_DERPT|nr:hypothetical protein DERP_004116 [Dermatophagoides pteronyssinus]
MDFIWFKEALKEKRSISACIDSSAVENAAIRCLFKTLPEAPGFDSSRNADNGPGVLGVFGSSILPRPPDNGTLLLSIIYNKQKHLKKPYSLIDNIIALIKERIGLIMAIDDNYDNGDDDW